MMNPENNTGNNFESQSFEPTSLGSAPINDTPVAPVGQIDSLNNDTNFVPFENLNNQDLNVPNNNVVESFEPTPVDPASFNSEVTQTYAEPVQEQVVPTAEPVVESAPVVEPVYPETAPVDNSFAFAQPETNDYQGPVETVTAQGENLYEGYEQYQTPQVDNSFVQAPQAPAYEAPQMPTSDDTLYSVAAEQPTQVAPQVEGPTMPIPDSMPTTDYEAGAGVSTPVDYATPMSDFDQIGSTPELDPKQKNKNKKTGKTLLFVLIIVLIAALGAGSYYLINIKKIFNSSSVETKTLKLEAGEELSTDINEYATFKNTSASNCVLDTNSVNTTKAGKYEYIVKCGEDSYKGTIEIIDTKAPDVEFNTTIAVVGTTPEVSTLISSCTDENCTYTYEDETKATEAFATAGYKTVAIKVSDGTNSKTVYAPVMVLSSDLRFALAASKDVESEDAKVEERNIVLYNGDQTEEVAVTEYVITFASKAEYKEAIKSYSGEETFTYNDLTGSPVFVPSLNRVVLVNQSTNENLKQVFQDTYNSFREAGYVVAIKSTINISDINFNK